MRSEDVKVKLVVVSCLFLFLDWKILTLEPGSGGVARDKKHGPVRGARL